MTEEHSEVKETKAPARAKGIHTANGSLDQEVWFHGVRYSHWYTGPYPNPDPEALNFTFYTTFKTHKRTVNEALKSPHILKVVEGHFTLRQLLEAFGKEATKPYPEPSKEPEAMRLLQSFLHGETGQSKTDLLNDLRKLLT